MLRRLFSLLVCAALCASVADAGPIGTRRTALSGTRLWTPAQTTTAFWLDGADNATFAFGSGSLVSQWSDKSGNARHFSQATGGLQPTRNANVLNGLPGVAFNQ